jgi:hypothetical protein
MRVNISKYELRMIKINEYHFNDRDNTFYTSERNRVISPKCTLSSSII